MIKIRKFNEEFYDGMLYDDTYHEIFINPTKKELDIVYKEGFNIEGYRGIRFIAKNDTKQLFVFNSDLLHAYAVKKIFNKNGKILLDANYQMVSGSIEGNDYVVSESDTLWESEIKFSNDPVMYLEFLLETDWSWIDKYIYFSDWWEETMVPKLKLQLITIEQEKLSD
ncbi:hypothetical protein LCGC14_1202230 [marine sediment metagenome]|uniref:Uncharacterized protein n=1 Tax=marine sediment metagenome TaxID=412755 RepID=A0A0F9LKZ7_9ZZZZ